MYFLVLQEVVVAVEVLVTGGVGALEGCRTVMVSALEDLRF